MRTEGGQKEFATWKYVATQNYCHYNWLGCLTLFIRICWIPEFVCWAKGMICFQSVRLFSSNVLVHYELRSQLVFDKLFILLYLMFFYTWDVLVGNYVDCFGSWTP